MKSKKMVIGTYTKMEFVKLVFKAFQMVELFITTVKAKCNMASKTLMAIGTILIKRVALWLLGLPNYQMVVSFIIMHRAKCNMAVRLLIITSIISIQYLALWHLVKQRSMAVTITTMLIPGFKKKD